MLLPRASLVSPSPMLLRRRRSSVPLWLQLVQAAEQAARDAGALLWYVPPAGYADRSVNGPFVGSDGSGGVPAVGSGPVGWLRDAAGVTAGPEMIANGDFSSGATGWTHIGDGGLTTTGSVASITRVGQFTAFSQQRAFIIGRRYQVSAQIRRVSGSGLPVMVLRTTNDSVGANARVTVSEANPQTAFAPLQFEYTATSTENLWLQCGIGSAPATVEFDNVSIRDISGSHATQATSANRPVLVNAPGAAAAALGFGALSLDGTNDFMLGTPLAATPTTETYGAACVVDGSQGAFRAVVSRRTGTAPQTGSVIYAQSDNVWAAWGALNGGGWNQAFGPAVVVGDPIVLTQQTTATTETLWVNGTSPIQIVLPGGWNPQPAASPLAIGSANSAGEFFFRGRIGAVWHAPNSLTAQQRAALERLGAFIVGAPYPGL